jgi:hypothetical protein
MDKYTPSLNLGVSGGLYLSNPLIIYLTFNMSLFTGKSSDDYLPIPEFSFINLYRFMSGDITPYAGFSMGIATYRMDLPPYTFDNDDPSDDIYFSLRKLAAHGSLIAGVDFKLSDNVIFYTDTRAVYFDFKGGGIYWTFQGGFRIFFKKIRN